MPGSVGPIFLLLALSNLTRRVCFFLQNISTPIITAKLVQDDSKTSARVVKAKIEKTTLGQVRKI